MLTAGLPFALAPLAGSAQISATDAESMGQAKGQAKTQPNPAAFAAMMSTSDTKASGSLGKNDLETSAALPLFKNLRHDVEKSKPGLLLLSTNITSSIMLSAATLKNGQMDSTTSRTGDFGQQPFAENPENKENLLQVLDNQERDTSQNSTVRETGLSKGEGLAILPAEMQVSDGSSKSEPSSIMTTAALLTQPLLAPLHTTVAAAASVDTSTSASEVAKPALQMATNPNSVAALPNRNATDQLATPSDIETADVMKSVSGEQTVNPVMQGKQHARTGKPASGASTHEPQPVDSVPVPNSDLVRSADSQMRQASLQPAFAKQASAAENSALETQRPSMHRRAAQTAKLASGFTNAQDGAKVGANGPEVIKIAEVAGPTQAVSPEQSFATANPNVAGGKLLRPDNALNTATQNTEGRSFDQVWPKNNVASELKTTALIPTQTVAKDANADLIAPILSKNANPSAIRNSSSTVIPSSGFGIANATSVAMKTKISLPLAEKISAGTTSLLSLQETENLLSTKELLRAPVARKALIGAVDRLTPESTTSDFEQAPDLILATKLAAPSRSDVSAAVTNTVFRNEAVLSQTQGNTQKKTIDSVSAQATIEASLMGRQAQPQPQTMQPYQASRASASTIDDADLQLTSVSQLSVAPFTETRQKVVNSTTVGFKQKTNGPSASGLSRAENNGFEAAVSGVTVFDRTHTERSDEAAITHDPATTVTLNAPIDDRPSAARPISPGNIQSQFTRANQGDDMSGLAAFDGLVAQRAGRVLANAFAEGGEVMVRLDPPSLGRIDMTVGFEANGVLRAVLAPAEPATLELMRREAGTIAMALAESGVRADTQSLKVEAGSQGNQSATASQGDARNSTSDFTGQQYNGQQGASGWQEQQATNQRDTHDQSERELKEASMLEPVKAKKIAGQAGYQLDLSA